MKKQKFDFKAKRYMNTHFIKDDKAVISIKAKSLNDFYDEMDADRITISPKITNFIDKRIDYIPYRYQIVINIYCDDMSDEEKKKITSMIRAYYGLEANEKNKELRLNNIKSFSLFMMGIIFLGLASISESYGFLIKEILSIAGWVAVWETVTSVLFDAIKIKLDKLDATNLYKAEINFIKND